jgi:hypothetical protein
MSIIKDLSSNTSSSTTSTRKYPLSGDRAGDRALIDACNNLSSRLTGVVVAATIMTSASTLPPQPISIDSSASIDLGVHSLRRTRRSSQAAIAAFSIELQRRSSALSNKDAEILRKVILSKSQPGIPRF